MLWCTGPWRDFVSRMERWRQTLRSIQRRQKWTCRVNQCAVWRSGATGDGLKLLTNCLSAKNSRDVLCFVLWRFPNGGSYYQTTLAFRPTIFDQTTMAFPLISKILILINVLYWLVMENIARHKDAKVVGTNDSATVKSEYGNSSIPIVFVQFFSYFASIIFRLSPVSLYPIDHLYHDVDGTFKLLSVLSIQFALFGFLLRFWSMTVLGKFFSRKLGVQGSKHEVIRVAPYDYIRHPGYAANVVMQGTYAFAVSGDLVMGLTLWISYIVVLLTWRIVTEEEMLMKNPNTGEKYKAYMKDVRYKIIPFVV